MTSLVNSSVGEYRLLDLLGTGGMGEVYRAVHTRFGRVVAVKILTACEGACRERFESEARIQSSLRHPAIASYYGVHELRGRPCLILEYVDGQTLCDRIRAGGPLNLSEALAIFHQVVEAVAYVHSQGIVHRDLKANNIKITNSGQVKLLDFGIAREHDTPRLTRMGMLVGTLENLAPEQIGGAEGDARSDVWALGVLLYEMVTGRLPFDAADTPELYHKIRRSSYPAPSTFNPEIPGRTDRLIGRCLEKNPSKRFSSAAELLQVLNEAPVDRRRLPRWVPAGIVLLLLAPVVLLILPRTTRQIPPELPISADPQLRTVTVDVVGGAAEVYDHGRRLGVTPYQVSEPMGRRVELVLRRTGDRDLPVEFEITERSHYIYRMDQKDR